ncbi:MAG: hypothetical protein WAQ29_05690 [Nitrososphaeraceae archaeon]
MPAKRNNASSRRYRKSHVITAALFFLSLVFGTTGTGLINTFVIIYAAINSTIGQFTLSILARNVNVNTNAKVNQLSLHGTSYLNFINAINSIFSNVS